MTNITKRIILDINKLREAMDSREFLFLLRKNIERETFESVDIFLYSEDLDSFYFPPDTRGEPDEEFRMKFMDSVNLPQVSNDEEKSLPQSEKLSYDIEKRKLDMIPEKYRNVFPRFLMYLEKKGGNYNFIPLCFRDQFLGFMFLIMNDEYKSECINESINFLIRTCEDILYLQMKEWQIEKYKLECMNARNSLTRSENIKLIGEMTGGITHEFNNIFTGIMGFSQLIQMTSFDEEVKESIDEILKVAREGKAKIDYIQRTKKIDPEETDSLVDVYKIVKETAGNMGHLILSLFPDKISGDIFRINFEELSPLLFPEMHMRQFFSMIFISLLKKKYDLIEINGMKENKGFIIDIEYSKTTEIEKELPVRIDTFPDFPESLILQNLAFRMNLNLKLKPGKITIIFKPDKTRNLDISRLQGKRAILFEKNPNVSRMFHLFFKTFGFDYQEIESLTALEKVLKSCDWNCDILFLDMGAYPTIEKITFPDNHPPVILTSAWGGYLNIKSVDNTKISGILSKPFSFENLIDFFN